MKNINRIAATWWIPSTVIIILGISGLLLYSSGFCTLRTCEIDASPWVIQAIQPIVIQICKNKPIFEVDISQLKKRLEDHYAIKRATIYTYFPDFIKIEVDEAAILAYIEVENSTTLEHTYFGMNTEGVILEPIMETASLNQLPKLVFEHPIDIYPGKEIDFSKYGTLLVGLDTLRTTHPSFFNSINQICLAIDPIENFFTLKSKQGRFVFGESLNEKKIQTLMSFVQSKQTHLTNNCKVNLRFDDIIITPLGH